MISLNRLARTMECRVRSVRPSGLRQWNKTRQIVIAVLALSMVTVIASAQGTDTEVWKAPAFLAKKKNPIPSTEQSRTLGHTLYVKNCLSCHGVTGVGDGPAAKDLQKHPGNLSNPALWDQTDGALFFKITVGRRPMPSFRELLTDEQRWTVINYVRTLAPHNTPTPPKFEASDAVRKAVSAVFHAYATVQEALVKDDFAAARGAVKPLLEATAQLASTKVDELKPDASGAWFTDSKQLVGAGQSLSSASDLAALRQAFGDFSADLITTIQDFGHDDGSLVELHCPMAFNKKGASWVQSQPETHNPYLGSAMPACGDVQTLMAASRPIEKKSDAKD